MKSVVPDTKISKSCYHEVVPWGKNGSELRYILSLNYVFVWFFLFGFVLSFVFSRVFRL